MKALVLEKTKVLSLRDISIDEPLGPSDVRIQPKAVGICGSDLHYYLHGAIGHYVVNQPMVLGHEAAGLVVEVGREVRNVKVGDRVCMEPGIPRLGSPETLSGRYNVDPAVRFWATPPVHGVLRETVVHPAAFTFPIGDNVSFAEGAFVEPLAIGVHSASVASIKPGDVAVVTGAGTIGVVTAAAALAAGCSKVILADVLGGKLDLARALLPVVTVNLKTDDLADVVKRETGGRGAEVVFEASGAAAAVLSSVDHLAPGGRVVLIGIPQAPAPIDIVRAQAKEAQFLTIFRYVNDYPRALRLLASGKIDVKKMITSRFGFNDSVAAFEFAAQGRADTMKVMIDL
jgi:D-xylulose reductase